MTDGLDMDELVNGLRASGLNAVLISGSADEACSEAEKPRAPAPPPDVLCWTGLTAADVKTEFPDMDDGFIRDFILDHEDGICEAMSMAAMDYVINSIGDY